MQIAPVFRKGQCFQDSIQHVTTSRSSQFSAQTETDSSSWPTEAPIIAFIVNHMLSFVLFSVLRSTNITRSKMADNGKHYQYSLCAFTGLEK
jgi:hypothetical protein